MSENITVKHKIGDILGKIAYQFTEEGRMERLEKKIDKHAAKLEENTDKLIDILDPVSVEVLE
jgi:hypothetical protein